MPVRFISSFCELLFCRWHGCRLNQTIRLFKKKKGTMKQEASNESTIICITYNSWAIFSPGWLGIFKDTITSIRSSRITASKQKQPVSSWATQIENVLCMSGYFFKLQFKDFKNSNRVILSNMICSVCMHKQLRILQEVRILDDHDTLSKEKLKTII